MEAKNSAKEKVNVKSGKPKDKANNPMRTITISKVTLNIGTGKDQVLLEKAQKLLKQITGIAALFKDGEFSKAWEFDENKFSMIVDSANEIEE